MLDDEGSVETARQGMDARNAEDRKVDLVVRELGRYGMKVAPLQETKWFGRAVYRVGESVVLAAGRPVPVPGEPVQRGEGVAIVLSGPASLLKSKWSKFGRKVFFTNLSLYILFLAILTAFGLKVLSPLEPICK